jgi:alpha-L-rhamnosidase
MRAYVDYLSRFSHSYIAHGSLGDWLEVGAQNASKRTPLDLTSTAVYYCGAELLSRTAALLGRADDAARYAALATNIQSAFNQRFVGAEGLKVKDSQTSLALALEFGLVPTEQRPQLVRQLLDDLAARDGHLSTGIIGTHYLFHALSNAGRGDVAYKVLTAEGYPGYFNWLDQGATALWEQWDGANSRCHPTFGCVGAWLYQGLAGIKPDASAPGFKKIVIQPCVVQGLTWAEATYDSVHGRVASRWQVSDGKLQLCISIPVNTTATVYVPAADAQAVRESGLPAANAPGVQFLRKEQAAAVFAVGSGTYQFEAPWP